MVKIIRNINDMQNFRNNCNSSIGFVPTMGNLHDGHKSLITQSVKQNKTTVISIFINPTQFNNQQDLANYPQTFEQDTELANKIGVDIIFAPKYKELYPDNYNYKITENKISVIMEGISRPGHFDGMLTVVLKLLMLIKPTKAYFGEKDYQQLELIRGLCQAFFVDSKIIACPTIRNNNGLALSSRNNLLTSEQLKKAVEFPKALKSSNPVYKIKKTLENLNFKVDYIEDYNKRRYGAVNIGPVRLIDNVSI